MEFPVVIILNCDENSNAAYHNNLGVSYSTIRQEDIDCYSEAIKHSKQPNAGFYRNRAIALSNKRKHSEAIADLDRAIEIDPQHGGYHSSRGYNHVCLGQQEEACRDFITAATLEPEIESHHSACGHALMKLERYDEAIEYFSKGEEIFMSFLKRFGASFHTRVGSFVFFPWQPRRLHCSTAQHGPMVGLRNITR